MYTWEEEKNCSLTCPLKQKTLPICLACPWLLAIFHHILPICILSPPPPQPMPFAEHLQVLFFPGIPWAAPAPGWLFNAACWQSSTWSTRQDFPSLPLGVRMSAKQTQQKFAFRLTWTEHGVLMDWPNLPEVFTVLSVMGRRVVTSSVYSVCERSCTQLVKVTGAAQLCC